MEDSCLLSQKTVLVILLRKTCFLSADFLNECFYLYNIDTYLPVI